MLPSIYRYAAAISASLAIFCAIIMRVFLYGKAQAAVDQKIAALKMRRMRQELDEKMSRISDNDKRNSLNDWVRDKD